MTSSKYILIVDNDRVMTKLMSHFLESKGHHVIIAHDGFEALDILKTVIPDIIYIDLIMPKLGGDKLCQMIRLIPRLQDCHIVIISATLAEESLDLATIGANSAIAKGPFSQMSGYIEKTIETARKGADQKIVVYGAEDFKPRHITRELLSQNKYFQQLLDSISQGVIEIEENRVLYANGSAVALLKIEHEVLIGSLLDEILDRRIWKVLEPHISSNTNRSSQADENNPVILGSSHLIVQSLLLDQNTKKRVVLLTDITARKRMEAIVEATNLTENLGFIFSGIRHELGNPINIIKMALSALNTNISRYDSDTIAECITRSLAEVERLEYLLKTLNNYNLFEKPYVEKVAIDDFINSFISLVREDLEKRGIQLLTRFEKEKAEALTDARALHHVMLNLLTNAADAMTDVDDPVITITTGLNNGSVVIKVGDNGCGMEQDVLEKICSPFFTSKPQGSGLGLAIAHKMLSSMNSTIHFESLKHSGTTVTLRLPAAT